MNSKSKIKSQNPQEKQRNKQKDILKNLYALFNGRERVLDILLNVECSQ